MDFPTDQESEFRDQDSYGRLLPDVSLGRKGQEQSLLKQALRAAFFAGLAFAAGNGICNGIYYGLIRFLGLKEEPFFELLGDTFPGSMISFMLFAWAERREHERLSTIAMTSAVAFDLACGLGLIIAALKFRYSGIALLDALVLGVATGGAVASAIYGSMIHGRRHIGTMALLGACALTLSSLVSHTAVTAMQTSGFLPGPAPWLRFLLVTSIGWALWAFLSTIWIAAPERTAKPGVLRFVLLTGLLLTVFSMYPYARTTVRFTPLSREYFYCRGRHDSEQRRNRLVGKPAPELILPTLSGKLWRLEDQKRKVVLIDFWPSRCGPYRDWFSLLKPLYQKYRLHPDFLLVGVSTDDNLAALRRVCEEERIEWLQLNESEFGLINPAVLAFGVKRLPDLCLVDKAGIVRGVDLSVEEADRLIETLLKGD